MLPAEQELMRVGAQPLLGDITLTVTYRDTAPKVPVPAGRLHTIWSGLRFQRGPAAQPPPPPTVEQLTIDLQPPVVVLPTPAPQTATPSVPARWWERLWAYFKSFIDRVF